MNTDHLALFRSVARLGSIADAARAHDLDPSTVSRALAALENELGTRLVQRTTRRLQLTQQGAHYLARIEPVLTELGRANDDVAQQTSAPKGRVKLGASVSFGQTMLVPLLPRFSRAFPELGLDLVLSDENVDLVREGLDLAIRLAPSIQGDLVCFKVMSTRYRVVASPGYRKTLPTELQPRNIEHAEILHYTLPAFQNSWTFRNADGNIDTIALPPGQLRFNNANSMRSAMLQSCGLALMADYLVADELGDGQCVDVFPDHDVTATTFDTAAWIVYPSRTFLPAKTRAVVDFLRTNLKQDPRQ